MRRFTFTNVLGTSIVLGPTAPLNYVIKSVRGLDIPDFMTQIQKAPGQDGITYIDGLLDSRTIEIEGAIARPNDMADIYPLRALLTTALNPKLGPGTLVIEYDTGSLQVEVVPVVCLFAEKGRDQWQQFHIEFLASSPYLQSTILGLDSAGFANALTYFPLALPATGIPFSSRKVVKSAFINNNGNVVSPVLLTLFGPVTNPVIINLTTGEYIRFYKTLAAGDSIVVDTDKLTSVIRAGYPYENGLQYMDLASTFWKLIVGVNEVTFNDDTNSVTARCDIAWRDLYIGI